MKRKLILVSLLFLVMFILPLGSKPILNDFIEMNEHSVVNLSDYEAHDPILITSDEDFETQGWPGNGTIENPFMIEALSIDGRLSPSELYSIRVQNVQSYFVIEDCYLYRGVYGIYLKNVTNGVLRYNDCMWNDYGIYLDKSYNNTILDNDCSYQKFGNPATWGIYLIYSNYNTIVDNICFKKFEAIYLWSSNNNTIDNNHCDDEIHGISVSLSHSTIIVNNTCLQFTTSGIGVYDSNYVVISNNTCISPWNGPIGINIIAKYEPFIHHGIVANNTCNGNSRGIYIDGVKEFTIIDNICNDNYVHGFSIDEMMNSILVENTAMYNSISGIYLGMSSTFNTLYNNTFGWNNDLQAQSNAIDNGIDNSWDDGIEFGNLYGDYTGEEEIYEIDGSAGSIDHYPRKADTIAPILVSEDLTYELGSVGNGIIWYVTELHPDNFFIEKDGILDYTGDSYVSTIEFSVDGLSLGVYNFTLVVNDTCGNVAIDTVLVTVVDTTSPQLSSPENIEYEFGTVENSIIWNVFDFCPYIYELYINGSLDEMGLWEEPFIMINIDGLPVGQYSYTLLVSDTSGNIATDTVLVTVADTTAPQLDSPIDFEYEFNITGNFIIWGAFDLNPHIYVLYINGDLNSSGSWDEGGIVIDIDGLSVGRYNYTLLVNDTSGNVAMDTVIVTVTEIAIFTTTTTTTTTTDKTTTDTDGTIPLVSIMLLLAGIGGVCGIIALIIVIKRK